MSVHTVPPPEGPMPLLYTATCEQCRPRYSQPFDREAERDQRADTHELGTDHRVTRGTMRGAHT